MVVAPDAGRIKTAEKLREYLHADLAFIYKRRRRHEAHKIEEMAVVGEVDGPPVRPGRRHDRHGGDGGEGRDGARERWAPARSTPPRRTRSCRARRGRTLEEAPIEQVVVTNTVPIPEEQQFAKLRVLSIAPLIARALRAVFEDSSVSEIFDGDNQV